MIGDNEVYLTEKGQEMITKINNLTSVILEQSFDGLTPLQIEKTLCTRQK